MGANPRAVDNAGLPPAHYSAVASGTKGIKIWRNIVMKDGKKWHEDCELCGSAAEDWEPTYRDNFRYAENRVWVKFLHCY